MEKNKKIINYFWTIFCIISTFFQLIIFINFLFNLIINKNFLFNDQNNGIFILYIFINLILISCYSYLGRLSFKKIMDINEEEDLKVDNVLMIRTEKHYYLRFYTPFLILKKLIKLNKKTK